MESFAGQEKSVGLPQAGVGGHPTPWEVRESWTDERGRRQKPGAGRLRERSGGDDDNDGTMDNFAPSVSGERSTREEEQSNRSGDKCPIGSISRPTSAPSPLSQTPLRAGVQHYNHKEMARALGFGRGQQSIVASSMVVSS